MVQKGIRFLVTLAILVVMAAAVTFLFICWQVNRTGSHDQVRQTEAIIVLGARVEADGQAGPDLYERTMHAVALFQRGFAPYIICTGGFHQDRLSAAAVARQLAISQGVPPDQVLIADGSSTTREDASRAAELMALQGWQTATLVSHPLHLQRARLHFEDEGLVVYTSPTSTDLSAIPWRTRAVLTVRETVGILWIYLEQVGIPYEWTTPLSRWVYGLAPTPCLG
jgi:uncharacterized SAM-binding protein YcdF (DUF218 family)